MQIALPELHSPATLILDREHGLSDDEYLAFCDANPDLRLERTAQGEILIVPPAGGESDYRSADTIRQLGNWARKDGRGKSFGSSVEFLLPDRSAFSPDSQGSELRVCTGIDTLAGEGPVAGFVLELGDIWKGL
jgi:hypothetical protein